MKRILSTLRRNQVAGKYIFSGLFQTAIYTLVGFVILRWIMPQSLGRWQSFTVFVGYINILTLGTTSGLNRELPYYLGKGEEEKAMDKLRAGGFFTTALSLSLMGLTAIIGLILGLSGVFSTSNAIMFVFAFATAALSIQTNFLGATFRSANSFDKLANIQLINAGLYIVLLPLIYFFNIWGYIAYQTLLALFLYLGYYLYRPYKIKYSYNLKETVELVRVGLPIYIWNYLASISRSIPRLTLVVLGTPMLVGLYSPAGSINAAMLNLPGYTNRYLFPQMSYRFGKTNDKMEVFRYARKAAGILFIVMFSSAVVMAIIIPPMFTYLFPKYVEGIAAAQIAIFSGVFYSINGVFHNALNSVKSFKPFRYIITLRVVYIIISIALVWGLTKNLLLSVALGAVIAEGLNVINYYFSLKRSCQTNP